MGTRASLLCTACVATLAGAIALMAGVAPARAAAEGRLLSWDGAVVGWGSNSHGQAAPPRALQGTEPARVGTASAVSVGIGSACAIQAETGAVVCWGAGTGGPTPPASVDGTAGTATALDVGGGHICAIQAETGAVVCWGADTDGQATPPASVDGTAGTAIALDVGVGHSCAIQAETGAVVCWGADTDGQATPPASVDGTTGTAIAVDVGTGHSCAIQAGTAAVVCWGFDLFGESTPPPGVDGTTGTASAIAAGELLSCAIQAETGAVLCWGWIGGQASPPADVDGTSGTATAITAGTDLGCAIEAGTGKVVCWGFERGPGVTDPPASVGGDDGTAIALSAGQWHGCAIQAGTRAVLCWGNDDWGQATPPPGVDGTAGTARALASGVRHSCALQAGSGAVVCWGDDAQGQATPPASVDGTNGSASAIAAGYQHSCAIQAGSAGVVCWGDDGDGQATSPPDVDGTAGTASAIAGGVTHSCAIQAGTGAVVCWGWAGGSPPASVDGTAGTASAIATGGGQFVLAPHSCAIQAETGAVVCWGSNQWGKASPPADVDGTGGTASAITAGGDHSCAIQSGTGAVVCWGHDTLRQVTPPAALDGKAVLAISAGGIHTLAVRARCSDGLDDDGDGLVDFPDDPGCWGVASVTESPRCQDGLDNDGDGLIDFDGGLSVLGCVATDSDPQCVDKPWKHKERAGCGLGFELALILPLLMGLRRRRTTMKRKTTRRFAQIAPFGVALALAIGIAGPARAVDCSPGQPDLDLDGVVDACDNCPPSLCSEPLGCANPAVGAFDPTTMTTTGGQLDRDGDGLGDVCDLDQAPWEVSGGNGQVSCPDCPLECAGVGCPGSPAAQYPVGAVSLLGLERACDTSVPGFADGEVTPGCHPVCDLDADPSTPDQWCRNVDVFVWYPASQGTPVGPSWTACETGGTRDSCEALGCVWGNDYFPGYFFDPLDFRCMAAEAAVNAPLVPAADDRALPVLFLSHGSPGSGPRDLGHLAARLAESGYVVVSVSHASDQWFEKGWPHAEGFRYQELFAFLHSLDPISFPLLDQNPYCNATTAAIVQQVAPGRPHAGNFSGFDTKEECLASGCGLWDEATGCDAAEGAAALELLQRERGRDISDVVTYLFGGDLYDGEGLQARPPPGGGWNESGHWPWGDAWNGRTGVLDPNRIGVVGHSFGGLTAVTLVSKAAYAGYQPVGTPDWDTQRFRDPRIRAALLWAPGALLGVPRVLAPLSVPTMIQSGVYDFTVPFTDELPALLDCVPPEVSGTGAEDPLCSIEGLFAAAQFDAPELEPQGLLAESADPPRFLTRLDTAGHITFFDEEVAAFQISCPDDPSQPCSCVDAGTEFFLGVAECTQLAGDRAKAEGILLENALSFLNAFVAGNPSGWTAREGDQHAASEVAGFLTADWDRDAPACGLSPLLGDGVLDSLDPEPLVCNLPVVPVSVDAKPGSCPNAYNRSSNGVLPVAVVGTEEFDVLQVDLSTVEICRVDPDSGDLIGCISPHEGPPGPHSEIEDVTAPFVGSHACDCEASGPDGTLDLSLKFKTAELVEALQLDMQPPGPLPELVVTGSLLDGTPFQGSDCVRLVPPGTRIERVSVEANAPGAWIDVRPLDETLDSGGFCGFERSYPQTTEVTLTASPVHAGRAFRGWRVDGGSLLTQATISLAVAGAHELQAVYQEPGRCGLGFELALILPALMGMRLRRLRRVGARRTPERPR